jgi:hypothetical protein
MLGSPGLPLQVTHKREESFMTKELRWRVIILQIVVIVLLAFGAGIGFWAHNFTHDLISSQLSEQQIVVPTASSAKIKSLPAADVSALAQYEGQTIADGYQAHAYADHIIRVDLNTIGHGKAYGYYSAKSIAEAKTNPKQSAADEATALTLFRGDTLRSLLDQAWAFGTWGTLPSTLPSASWSLRSQSLSHSSSRRS